MVRVLLAAVLLAGWVSGAASEPVRIGLVLTLSGPSAAFGRHARDGFMLAVKQLGGGLGPDGATITLIDDERDVVRVTAEVDVFVKRDKPQVLVGPLFSDLMPAMLKATEGTGAILLSPNEGPALLAGKRCRADVFVLSQQDEQPIEVLARYAEERNLKRAIIVATAGEEAESAATAFKRAFKGEVADRLTIDTLAEDYADAINRIDLLRPQVVFLHLGSAAGQRFMRQFRASGASQGLLLLGSSGFDVPDLEDLKGAAVDVYTAGNWAQDLQTPENVAFVAAFEAEYGYRPGALAMHGFDAANLIDRALNLTGGAGGDKAVLAEAMKQADIESPRGRFVFANNNFPVQDLYVTRVVQRADGSLATEVVKQMFAQYGDHYASECPLK